MKKIRVFVVDDSLLFRRVLIDSLSKYDNIEVIGYAVDAFDARTKIPRLKPDVVTMDVEMPRLNGIDFLKQFIPVYQIPVIVVTSLNINVFEALSAGAVDFVHKPDMGKKNSVDSFLSELVNKISIASTAKVRVRSVNTVSAASSSNKNNNNSNNSANKPTLSSSSTLNNTAAPVFTSPRINNIVIALGASTGGTEATLTVLKDLPPDTPGIVVVQHMPVGFTKMYAERLDRLCKMNVKEAKNGDRIVRGQVLIAPGDLHMKVVKIGTYYTVNCFQGEKVSGHRPSVDVLFNSVAENVRDNAIGIILTGMGQDGAAGLLRMRQNGAYTIGQDKESCVVYGMPMMAYKMGAVVTQASCENISGVLRRHLSKL